MSIESTTAANAASTGITRRKVIKSAAWSAPVVAMAVATPLASASMTPDPKPNAYITGTLTGTHDTVTRVVSFSNGIVTYDADGTDLETGNITVSLPLFGNMPDFPLAVDEASWTSLGWTKLSNAGGNMRFRHSSIASGTVPMGTASWTGAADDYVQVAVGMTVAQGGVGSVGLVYTFDPDEA